MEGSSMAFSEQVKNCVIAARSCGRATNTTNMCFLARPSNSEYQLEEDILETLLAERGYQLYSAINNETPGYEIFCEKVCSKIISSRFCIVLLNYPTHQEYSDIRIPNPNVFLEYGMMLGFGKRIIPMQQHTDALPFDVFGLDTVKYEHGQFRQKASRAIEAIIANLYSVLRIEAP